MIRFRDKRFLAVAIVVAALVIFVLPAFVAFRYTAPDQRGEFLRHPWRGWSFAYAALAVPGDSELKTSGMALRKADWVFKGTAIDPREVQLLFVKRKQPYVFQARGRTAVSSPARWCPVTASSGRSRASSTRSRTAPTRSWRCSTTGRAGMLYDIRDDLTSAELAPPRGDTTSPSPAP